MTDRRPDRTLRKIDVPFWEHCAAGELRIPMCESCRALQWPVAERCEVCGAEEFVWTRMSGRGRLRSSCTFERQYHDECPPPWHVVLIELDEGPLFVSNLDQEIDDADLDDGMRVDLHFVTCSDAAGTFRLPVFRTT